MALMDTFDMSNQLKVFFNPPGSTKVLQENLKFHIKRFLLTQLSVVSVLSSIITTTGQCLLHAKIFIACDNIYCMGNIYCMRYFIVLNRHWKLFSANWPR